MKKFSFQIIVVIAILLCLGSIDANASIGETLNLPFNATAAIVVVVLLLFGLKFAAKNLQKVSKDLEDAFGEKVLP